MIQSPANIKLLKRIDLLQSLIRQADELIEEQVTDIYDHQNQFSQDWFRYQGLEAQHLEILFEISQFRRVTYNALEKLQRAAVWFTA